MLALVGRQTVRPIVPVVYIVCAIKKKILQKKNVCLSSCTTRMGAMGKDPYHASMDLRVATCADSKTEQSSTD